MSDDSNSFWDSMPENLPESPKELFAMAKTPTMVIASLIGAAASLDGMAMLREFSNEGTNDSAYPDGFFSHWCAELRDAAIDRLKELGVTW